MFSTSIIQLPVLSHRCFPGNSDHSIHAHVHRYQIDDFVHVSLPNSIISKIGSSQNACNVVAAVNPPVVRLLPCIDNCSTEQRDLLLL